ncbi:MAG: nucleotidyltransferase family protein [Gammaproteobacteria bacterium]|nr:nucleotidyltransferase family protein [Gammaproteobacteria bacterium]MDH3768077.1 nucleotidyltransferase family protein [Gammaproteobacteria bacterium]
MILAAGRGRRLRPLTDQIPKPLLQLAGETLLGRHLRALSSASISSVVINTAWLGWMIRHYVGDGAPYDLDVTISDEGETVLDTGGGILKAMPLLGAAPFMLLNADIWTDLDLRTIQPPGPNDLASLVLVRNPPHHGAGDFALDADRVVEHGIQLTYSGMAILRPELFAGCTDAIFPLAPLLRQAIGDGRVCGQRYDGAWFDIGTAGRLATARQYAAASK